VGNERVFMGIAVADGSVRVVSSLGPRSSITAERGRAPTDWVDLATYGLPLPEKHVLLACVAVPTGYPDDQRMAIVRAARQAGWDGAIITSAVRAVGRSLRQTPGPSDLVLTLTDDEDEDEDEDEAPGPVAADPDELALVVVDAQVSSVGIARLDGRVTLVNEDSVRSIAGREARELGVSLRCLLKSRPRDQRRRLCQRVVVTGDPDEIERIGRRQLEDELRRVGADRIEFALDPYLMAQGACQVAEETDRLSWRRARLRK
jgi:hypothetical protein